MNVKHLLTAVLLLITTAAWAQTTEKKKSAVSKINVQPFQKLVINASIDVLLIEDNEPGTLYIEGDASLFSDIAIDQSNRVLTINSNKEKSYRGKIYIGLPVKNLAAVDIYARSFVTGLNALQSKDLVVTMYEECVVNLKSTGYIEIRSGADIDFSFLKSLPKKYRSLSSR